MYRFGDDSCRGAVCWLQELQELFSYTYTLNFLASGRDRYACIKGLGAQDLGLRG